MVTKQLSSGMIKQDVACLLQKAIRGMLCMAVVLDCAFCSLKKKSAARLLLQAAGIRFIAFRNEQAAGYAAAASGFLTGVPGVLLTVSGPGAVHGIAGLSHAQVNTWPMLMISGSAEQARPRRRRTATADTVCRDTSGGCSPVGVLFENVASHNVGAAGNGSQHRMSLTYRSMRGLVSMVFAIAS